MKFLENDKPAIVSFGDESGIRFEIKYFDDDGLKDLYDNGWIAEP